MGRSVFRSRLIVKRSPNLSQRAGRRVRPARYPLPCYSVTVRHTDQRALAMLSVPRSWSLCVVIVPCAMLTSRHPRFLASALDFAFTVATLERALVPFVLVFAGFERSAIHTLHVGPTEQLLALFVRLARPFQCVLVEL